MPAYTHTAGEQQGATSASMNVPYPALSAGNLLLCIVTTKDFNGSTIATAPTGFTLLATSSPGTNDAIWLYGKIAAGTESGTIAVDTNTAGGQQAIIIAFPAPPGYAWPAIATAFVAATENSIAGSSDLTYGARTISANGNLGIQIGKEPVTGTVTAVATTSGFTQASWLQTDTYVGAVQYIQISGNIAQNAVAMTGNSGTAATGTLTAEFAPAVGTIKDMIGAGIVPMGR